MQKIKTFHKNHPVASTLIAVGIVAGVLVGSYGGFRYWQYFHSPEAVFQREAKTYEEDWNEMMGNAKKQLALPKDEVPTVATVSDKQSLDTQPFFKKAENGDKILLYKKSKEVYLYRPSLKKIISKSKLNYLEPTSIPFESSAVAGTTSASTEPDIEIASAAAEQDALNKLIPQ